MVNPAGCGGLGMTLHQPIGCFMHECCVHLHHYVTRSSMYAMHSDMSVYPLKAATIMYALAISFLERKNI